MTKTAKILGLIAFLFVGTCLIGISLAVAPTLLPWICGHPGFSKIKKGMTQPQVRECLGSPAEIKFNKGMPNFLGQGEHSNQIKEAWIFDFILWRGNIEIYFDSDGKVIGQNCGEC